MVLCADYELEGMVSGPITDNLFGRLAARQTLTDETTMNFGGASPLFIGAYWSSVHAPWQVFLTAEYRWSWLKA